MSHKQTTTLPILLGGVLAAAMTAFAQQEQKQPEPAQVKTEETQQGTQTKDEPKLISVPGGKALGMSILGNQEAPKALVIVPWKRSELGNVAGISTLLDDSKQPIDKEVFTRMLSYYEIRSETDRPGVGGPARSEEAAKAAYRTDLDGGPDANKRRKP